MNLAIKLRNETSKISREISSFNFSNDKTPVKFKRPAITKKLNLASAYGMCALTEQVINEHNRENYNSVDELIGDLQLIGLEMMNLIKKTSNPAAINKYQLSDFMEGGLFVKGGE